MEVEWVDKGMFVLPVNGIKQKLLIFALLATLVPSAGLGLLSFWQNEAMTAENVTHQLRTLVDDAGRELQYWLKERSDGVRALADSNAVINGLLEESAASAGRATEGVQRLPQYLRLVQGRLEPYLELTVVDATGRVVASSADMPAPVRLPEAWPQDAGTKAVIIDPPRLNEYHGRATLTLAVPVQVQGENPLGALVAVVDLGTLLPRLEYVSKAFPGELLLLDTEGRPLLYSRGPAAELSRIDKQTLQQLRAEAGHTMSYVGHTQQTVLGLVKRSNDVPLIIVAERDRAGVYQAWVRFRNLFLALVGGLTLVVGMIGWMMGRSIVTPLQRLSKAAGRIAAGDLAVQLPVARRDEIGHLTRVFNQMADKLHHSHEEIKSASLVLRQQNRQLEKLSITDSLTGLYNRNKLNEILAEQLKRFKRSQRPFAVLLLDIDHFKALNDTHGHLAGDQVLASVARTIAESIRSVDYAARYGGEEFLVVLPETTTSTARELAERICLRVRETPCQYQDQSLTVTLSIGVAGIRGSDDTADGIIARADHMLYEAKGAGRNRVCCAA
jgi:diguanylate cyclase (GGDEF)-like protein